MTINSKNNKYFNHLGAAVKCIEVKSKGRSAVKNLFFKQMLMLKRLFYFFRFGVWFNNKKGRKIVLLYIWETKKDQKSSEQNEKVKKIFEKLSVLKNGTYTKDIECSLIDTVFEDDERGYTAAQGMPVPTAKLLFHIHADEFGANNKSLEGSTALPNLEYLYLFLKKKEKQTGEDYGMSQEICDELAEAVCLEQSKNFTADAAKAIDRAFKKRKRVLFKGGWTGSPGHAIYYEIIPDTSSTASVRFYNLGGGVNRHSAKFSGGKVKYSPYIEFSGVSKERLLDKNHLKIIHELKTVVLHPNTANKTEFNEKDIYEGLVGILKPESAKEDFTCSETLFKTTQHSGICAWRSLMAFMSARLEGDQYKKFIIDIKMQSLADKTEAISSKTLTINEWRLASKSYQKLCRSVAKAYDRGIIGGRYMARAQLQLAKSESAINESKKNIFPASPGVAALKAPRWPSSKVKKSYFLTESLENKAQGITSKGESFPCSYVVDKINKAKSKYTPQGLKRVLEIAQKASENGEHHAVHIALNRYISSWPIDKGKNDGNDLETAKEMINDLGKIARLFFKESLHIPSADNVRPDSLYCLVKILYLQKKLLENEFNDMPFLRNVMKKYDIYFLLNDARKNHEYSKILYNLVGYTVMPKYTFDSSKDVGKSSHLQFENEEKGLSGFARKQFLDIKTQLSKNDPDFKHLPQSGQDARLFTSDKLPAWFQGLRDTLLYVHILQNEPIATPSSENLDLSWEFACRDVKDYNDKDVCKVDFGVKGLTGDLLKKYPALKEFRYKPELRYSWLLRPIKSEKLQRFVRFLCSINYNYNEKKVLADFKLGKEMGFSDEAFKELTHIFLRGKFNISEGFEYFLKHPEKLRDPDYQVLFQLIFFHRSKLHNECLINDFSDLFTDFLRNQYLNCLEENDIQTSVFLLRMLRLVSEFSDQNQSMDLYIGKLRAISRRNGLSIDEKGVIFGELIVCLGKKDQLSDQDIKDLLTGSVYLQENPVCSRWKCPQTEKEVIEALHIHAKQIADALDPKERGDGHKLLNYVSHFMRGTGDQQWQGSFPCFKTQDGRHVYYPLAARLISENHETKLPEAIRNHPDFRQLFTGIERAVSLKNGVYQFRGKHGFKTLIYLDNKNRLSIEQVRGDERYRFIPREAFSIEKKNALISRHLQDNFHHWQPLASPNRIEIVDPESEMTVYRAHQKNGRLKKIEMVKENFKLSLPSKVFTRFESPMYIQQWYNGRKKFARCELPRFNLSFIPDAKDSSKLLCDRFIDEGYYLSSKSHIPYLGSFQHYLILENPEGKLKVLIPKRDLRKNEKQKESLQPLFEFDMKCAAEDNAKQQYEVYDVDKSAALTSSSQESRLYLALILAAVQEYESAAKILETSGRKLSSYTPSQESLLSQLMNMKQYTGDASGNGIVLRLYASYLLVKNKVNSNLDVPSSSDPIIREALLKAWEHDHNITALRLKRHEELFVLKYLLGKEFNASLFVRLKQLDPDYAKRYRHPDVPFQEELSQIFVDLRQRLKNDSPPCLYTRYDQSNWKNLTTKNVLLTRINEDLKDRFFAFYDLAIHGPEDEKKWLKIALEFGKHQEKGEEWRELFARILDNPEKFPPLPDSSQNSREWFRGVVETAEPRLILKNQTEKKSWLPSEVAEEKAELPVEFKVSYHFEAAQTFRQTLDSKKCFLVKEAAQEINRGLNNWFEMKLKNPAIDEQLFIQEIKRLKNDQYAYVKNAATQVYSLNPGAETTIAKILNEGAQEKENQLKKLEIEILSLANRPPKSAQEKAYHFLLLGGRNRKVITLEELLVAFGKHSPASLKKQNPALTESEIETILNKVGDYLILATREQQRLRAKKIFEKFKNCPKEDKEDKNDYRQLLAMELMVERKYVPNAHPAYLVFEYYADILLRPMQVDKLSSFLQEKDQNPVMEMIMGSGKSKVLLPLLGLLRADGETISTLVVPKPLFESVSADTQKYLQEAFSQRLHTFHFNRNTQFTTSYLHSILDELDAIQKEGGCLIMTSKSLQCLILKFIEISLKDLFKNETSEELKLMTQILQRIRKNGHPLIDEADTILNVLHQICYSTGKKLSPDCDEIKLISEIYEIIYSDKKIKTIARIESNPSSKSNAGVLTEKLYQNKLKKLIAAKIVSKLQSMEFSSAEKTEKVKDFFGNLEEMPLAVRYLFRDSKEKENIQSFYDKQDRDIQNILALSSEVISRLLPHTLTRNCDERYGLDQKNGGAIAIPFAAANTPNIGSQFANHYITMNYTFQYYVKKGISQEIIEQQIKRLQGEALGELKEEGRGANLENTNAWKQFLKLKGDIDITLFNYNKRQLQSLIAYVNSSRKHKLSFISEIILPEVQLFSQKLACNSHNLIDFFLKASGFTGTLWNASSMHRKLSPEPEEGTDAKTLKLLWENKLNAVHSIQEGSVSDRLKWLKKQNISYDLISDAGGYFKEGGNARIACEMSAIQNKPVVYYNTNNEQVEFFNGKEVPLAESKTAIEDRCTFLDQSHTTGADVKQKKDAVGLVTIGRNMLLRDLLQSVWRLRGLDKSQRVKFLVSCEVESIIRQSLSISNDKTLSFGEILEFTIVNQARQQGKDNFKALRQELKTLSQSILLNSLLSQELTLQEKRAASEFLTKEWIESSALEPRDIYGIIPSKAPSQDVLLQEKKKAEEHIQKIIRGLPFLEEKEIIPTDIFEQIDNITSRLEGLLPREVTVPIRELDDDQTVEIEQETEQENQTQIQVQSHQIDQEVKLGQINCPGKYKFSDDISNELFPGKEGPSYYQDLPCFPLKAYLENDPVLKDYVSAFEGIYATLNVFEWPEEKPDISDLKLLGACRTPFHFVQVFDNDDILILSHNESSAKDHYNLTFGFYDKKRAVSLELLKNIVKVKFLNGDSDFTKKELKILKSWIEFHGAEKMQYLYEHHILNGFPEKAACYANSQLRRIWQ